MKLLRRNAPHIRHTDTNRTMMTDVLLLLVILCGMAYLFYGMRAIAICATSVAAATICDVSCVLLRGRVPNFRDYSPIVTGLIIALMMPATIDYTVVIIAAIFAIAIVKHPFGGVGENIFNPAAAGFAFVAICWPEKVFFYPIPFENIPVVGEITAKLTQSPAFTLKLGGVPTTDLSEMVLGNFPGPMGATNILVVVACLIFLLYRKTVRWQLPVSFIATTAAIAALFPRATMSALQSVSYEMMSGVLLFGAVFVISDPVTSPKRDSSLAIYGILAGIITMFFRYFGGFEESVMFAVLFANAFVPIIDKYNERVHHIVRRKRLETKQAEKA